MSRAKWKGPYVEKNLIKTFFNKKKLNNYTIEVTTTSRSSTIIPNFIGSFFNIYNGKTFSKVQITENMIGRKLGEFSPTRKKFSFKKKKLK